MKDFIDIREHEQGVIELIPLPPKKVVENSLYFGMMFPKAGDSMGTIQVVVVAMSTITSAFCLFT